MNFLPWLNLDFGQIVDFFNDLVQQHFWLSVAVVLGLLMILAVYLGTMAVSAVVQTRRLLRYLKRWYVAIPAAALVFGLLILSFSTVRHLRGTGLPVPRLSNIEPVLGEDQTLHWEFPAGGGSGDIKFEVEWSKAPDFSGAEKKIAGDTMLLLRADRNETLYWRVRAVDTDPLLSGHQSLGAWSKPVKIEQFKSVLDKIRLTKRITVAMENEFDRSIFRWYEHKQPGSAKKGDAGQEVSYAGVEIDLAYAIAGEICRSEIAGRRDEETGRIMACKPARAVQTGADSGDDCQQKSCVAIDVRIAALSFENVMNFVGQGKADIAISSITYKPDRERKYNILFGNQSYESTGFGLVSRAPDAGTAAAAGKVLPFLGDRVAVQAETTASACMEWLQKKLKTPSGPEPFGIVEHSRNVVALNALAHGRAGFAFVLIDQPFAEGWKKFQGDRRVQVEPLVPVFEAYKDVTTPPFCLEQQYRFAVRAGEYGLQQLADRVIGQLQASGQLANMKAKAGERFNANVQSARNGAEVPPAATGSVSGQ